MFPIVKISNRFLTGHYIYLIRNAPLLAILMMYIDSSTFTSLVLACRFKFEPKFLFDQSLGLIDVSRAGERR